MERELKPQKSSMTNEQYGQLHDWDVWLGDLFPKMEEDHRKMHEIRPYEARSNEALRDLNK